MDKEFIGEQPSRAPPPPPTESTGTPAQLTPQPSPQVQHGVGGVPPAPPPEASNTPGMPRAAGTVPEPSLAQGKVGVAQQDILLQAS